MLTFDFRDFERVAKDLGVAADQIPFALSQALNDGVEAAREELITKTWPRAVKVKNDRFLSRALRREFASKRKLRAAIFDDLGRGNLALHDEGGSRRARGSNIAVPGSYIGAKRGVHGVPKGQRPTALPNSFVTKGTGPIGHLKPGAIYVREGQYLKKGSRISRTRQVREEGVDARKVRLAYVLKPSVQMKADVPFHADFERVVPPAVWRTFTPRLLAAMAGRRR